MKVNSPIYARRFKAVVDTIESECPFIKTVVNISYKHSGLLDYLANYQGGVNYDVIGLDWYSNMGSMTDMLDYLSNRYSQGQIIVCETNLWDGTGNVNEDKRTAYVEQVMNEAYYHSSSKVKGLIFYELLDESAYGTADCESYFGLVNCDKNGNIGSVKPAYTKIQNLLDANKDVTTTSTISTTSSNVTTISTTSTGSNITTVVHVTDSALTDSSSTNVASVDTVAPLDYEQIDYPNDHILVKSYLKQIYGLNKGLLLTNSDFEFAYTWHITGVNLTEDDADMNLEVHCTSEYSKRFTELTNSADGMFLSFGQEAAFPGTVELTVPVNFAEGDAVQIYGYDATADCLYLLASDIYVT